MNFKKTLLLAGVLIAAVLYLVKVSEPRRKAELDKDKLFAFVDTGQIVRFSEANREGESFTVVPSGAVQGESSWALGDLPAAKVDEGIIQGAFSALKGLAFEGPISDEESGSDLSVFGLDKPTLTVTVQLKDGAQKEVVFGKKSEYLNKRYAKLVGVQGLYLVEEAGFQSLKKSRSDVRAKNPIKFATADVREVILETSLGRIVITQPAVGEWKVMDTEARTGSTQDIELLLNNIRALNVEEFIDGGEARLSEFGLDKPTATIDVRLRDGLKENLIRVIVGEAPAGKGSFFTYVGAPSVFKVSAEKVIPLRKGMIDLRERRLLKIEASDIEKLVSGGAADAPVEIQAAAMDWTVNGKISDPVFVEELLTSLANVTAVDFPKVVPQDALSQPFLTLTITKKKGVGGETTVLTVGKELSGPQGSVRYARVGDQGEVALIRDVEAKRIIPHEGALVQRSTPTPQAAQAAR
ncbi:MAG: hypothetical protein RL518_1579 [Pseudomonadota bacterium]|jgi:hypothetical protein